MLKMAIKNGNKAFCAFLTLGYPSIEDTHRLILNFEALGVDVVELGFPFSDPMADGPTIQFSSEEALKKGVKIEDSFKLVKSLRQKGCKIPIVFFGYFNPIFHYGLNRFVESAVNAGFNGVLIPDLPPDEEKAFQRQCSDRGLSQVFLIAPTSTHERCRKIAIQSKGFIYFVSLRGVTGARKAVPSDIKKMVLDIRRKVKTPVLIGFGVSSAKQAKLLSSFSDGVIVGSAIIDQIRNHGVQSVSSFVQSLLKAVKSGR